MARDPYKYFRIEARELVDQLGKAVLDLEKGVAAPELVARLLRLAHTLKGAARVVKLRNIADRAHQLEDLLAPLREGGNPLPSVQVDALLRVVDQIAAGVAALDAAPERVPEPAAVVAAQEPTPLLGADVEELDALLDGVSEANVQLAALRRAFGALERARRLSEQLDEALASPRTQQRSSGVGLQLGRMAAELRGIVGSWDRTFALGVDQMDRELRQVRDAGERLRLLPARRIFNTLERVARDAAQNLGKRVLFVPSGGDVRLDASMLTLVQQALVQAVRNAVAHGVEPEAQRVAAGKEAQARVSVGVQRRGNRVAFVCSDDGRGVDLDAVRRMAEQKGVLPADGGALSAEAVLELLLGGGFTTSGAVTEIAGRGVGLDVVRDAAHRLGGEVRIQTQAGLGTTLEILVPASLSSLDALIVETAGRTAAIPLDRVKCILRVSGAELGHSAQGAALAFEGKVIPFAPLERALRVDGGSRDPARSWSAVVVHGGQALAAIGVERLRGTENVVFRPLPAFTPADPVIAGAALDAQGNPRLVLDADGLVEQAGRELSAPGSAAAPLAPILVIDDSLTTRMLEQSILESAGFQVELACSAEEGLAKAKRRRYALFLVDVEMPGMDGFTFIESTRADPALRDIPAILVTSRNAAEDRQRGKSAGASAYVVKSEFEQAHLLEQIRSLVSRR
jgi:two-component system chemotaxis sensor kinase CheA